MLEINLVSPVCKACTQLTELSRWPLYLFVKDEELMEINQEVLQFGHTPCVLLR